MPLLLLPRKCWDYCRIFTETLNSLSACFVSAFPSSSLPSANNRRPFDWERHALPASWDLLIYRQLHLSSVLPKFLWEGIYRGWGCGVRIAVFKTQSAHYSIQVSSLPLMKISSRNGNRFPYVLGTTPPIYETFIHLLINILGHVLHARHRMKWRGLHIWLHSSPKSKFCLYTP